MWGNMAQLPRQPLNNLAPFQIQNGGDTIVTPTLVVEEVVFADGSTMMTAGVPSTIDAGTY